MGTFNNGLTAKLTNSLQWGPPDVVSASGLALSMYPGIEPITVSTCSLPALLGTTNLEIGGVFVGVFPMSAVRFFHTATTLNNGKVLLAGGDSSFNRLLFTRTGEFRCMTRWPRHSLVGPGMITPRMRHTATLLSNDGREPDRRRHGNFRNARYGGDIRCVDAAGFCSDWRDDCRPRRPYCYAPAKRNGPHRGRRKHDFGALPSLPVFSPRLGMVSSRRGHTATLLNSGKVLVTGGADGNGISLASAEIYDPATRQFSAIPGMTTARAFHRATLLNGGKVLLSGGFNGFSRPAAAELYDPDAGFMATGLMNAPRDTHTATLLTNGQVLIAGGEGSAGPLWTTEKYDPSSGIFSVTAINNNDHFDPTRIGHTATPAEQWTGSGRRRHSSGRGRPLSTQHLCAAGVDLDFCGSPAASHSSGDPVRDSWPQAHSRMGLGPLLRLVGSMTTPLSRSVMMRAARGSQLDWQPERRRLAGRTGQAGIGRER